MRFYRDLDDVSLDNYKLSKFEIFVHKNFKLPIFLLFCSLFIFISLKIYNSFILDIFANLNYSMIFFAISFFFFFFMSLRLILDIFGLIFGQKGHDVLKSKANIE